MHEEALARWTERMIADSEVGFCVEVSIPDSPLMKVMNSATAKNLWDLILSEHQARSEKYQAEMLRRFQNKRCSEVKMSTPTPRNVQTL